VAEHPCAVAREAAAAAAVVAVAAHAYTSPQSMQHPIIRCLLHAGQVKPTSSAGWLGVRLLCVVMCLPLYRPFTPPYIRVSLAQRGVYKGGQGLYTPSQRTRQALIYPHLCFSGVGGRTIVKPGHPTIHNIISLTLLHYPPSKKKHNFITEV